jgi:integrase
MEVVLDQDGLRDVSSLVVPDLGRLETTSTLNGVRLVNGDGLEVLAVTQYLSSLLASGASPASLRSYAMALLRWWRFLAAVEVAWDRASRTDVRDFVLWMRSTTRSRARNGKAATTGVPVAIGLGYAPATINHNLAVLRGFYADRMAAGAGPVVNPVPEASGRHGQWPQAHHNPMRPVEPHRRAPLRQKIPSRAPRGLPDDLFDALFTAMGCDRDRALLAFYVSTGARASELLGVTLDRVDVGRQLIGVHRKGSGRLQWLPASADAFVWLRLYQQHQPRPEGEMALWLTRRAPHRPLTYPAMRRVLQRANDGLGTSWTLHQLRHTAAQRMVADRRLSLVDVQWVLGHAHLTTTEVYLQPQEDEVVGRVLEHHRRRAEPPPLPPSGSYRSEVLRILLGEASGG